MNFSGLGGKGCNGNEEALTTAALTSSLSNLKSNTALLLSVSLDYYCYYNTRDIMVILHVREGMFVDPFTRFSWVCLKGLLPLHAALFSPHPLLLRNLTPLPPILGVLRPGVNPDRVFMLGVMLMGITSMGFYSIEGMIADDAGGSREVNAFYCAAVTLTTWVCNYYIWIYEYI